MGLTLSEEKTKVTHITEGFDFLGYRIIRSMGTSGKMVPKVLIPHKAIKQCQYKVRGMLGPWTTNESFSAKMLALNRLIRGWCEYYRSTSSPQWGFREVERKLIWDMAHWLGKKHKVKIPIVLRKYMKENQRPSVPKQQHWYYQPRISQAVYGKNLNNLTPKRGDHTRKDYRL